MGSPAVGATAAQELIAEIGVDSSRFPSAEHLVSWAKFCPRVPESAARKKNTGRDKWQPVAGRHPGQHRRRGCSHRHLPSRPLPAHRQTPRQTEGDRRHRQHRAHHRCDLLADPQARYRDLGADHYQSRINKERRARTLASQLQTITGQRITIRDGKAVIIEPEAA